ncbi:GDSL-type esterase/lipase family protein [Uliginosibacterium sp. 31-16]|uniref:GDSL-type esterase/lipase family protein n=1 Tax=Uliginosibacterium sp. 31-16 TaxID=3068315 RepID=UPI00273FAF62|nr:GDSL-type esterase/lipase family protein [Uliginosibacterium sp. 31-16]MDP5241195.1 GDSL-type esterase/lipase family protein [Uliginosibacterium sp. 31-16]
MRLRFLLVLASLGAVTLLSACAQLSPIAPEPTHSGLGTPKKDGGKFLARHQSFLRRAQEGPVDLLFIGDSITEGWASKAPVLWQQQYGAHRPANFGIGGDRVEHVLWRLDNGELDGIAPKVIVLLIGTNNSASQSGAQIAASIRQIVELITRKRPQSRILLLGIFPRGPRRDASGRMDDAVQRLQTIRETNTELAHLDDGQRIRYLDIGPRFLRDGQIPPELMPDQLHPSLAGYRIWAEAMQPLLDEMLDRQ